MSTTTSVTCTCTPSRDASHAAVSLISPPSSRSGSTNASPACSVSTASTVASSSAGDVLVEVETDFGNVDLLQYIGSEAVADTQALTRDPHVTIVLPGLEPRLCLVGQYSNSKEGIDRLKKSIVRSAARSGIYLNANIRSQYRTIEFYCRDGVNSRKGKCTLRFVIRYDTSKDQCDTSKNRCYLKVGSGCPHHSAHRLSPKPKIEDGARKLRRRKKDTERVRKRRRREKEEKRKVNQELANAALEQYGLTSSDFDGDAITHKVAAAAAVAASAVPSSSDPFVSSGRCYLIPPVIEFDPKDIMVSCSCKAHASKHFWLGPKPDGLEKLIADLCISCGVNDEKHADIEEEQSGDGIAAASSLNPARALPPPIEAGINRKIKHVDKLIANEFNSDKPFFALKISKPIKATKAGKRRQMKYQELSISGFPAKSNPAASCSRLKLSQNVELMMQNEIIEAGKNLFASRWEEDAETRLKGSSSKYYTLVLHDHTAESGVIESSLSSIYFRPLENTRYWWISYLTTREGKATERKGYGSMMMWRLINMARREEGIEEILLEVDPRLKGARKLYENIRFEEIDWDDLPDDITNYEMVSQDLNNPEKTVKERVYKHRGEFVLMRLKLSIFPPL